MYERYEIRVAGHLSQQWAERFEGVTISLDPSGETLLCGATLDQAKLFSVLKAVRDLGLSLRSVVCVEQTSDAPQVRPETSASTAIPSCEE